MKLYGLEFLETYKPMAEKAPKTWAREPAYPQFFEDPRSFLQNKPIEVFSAQKKAPQVLVLGGESVTLGFLAQRLRQAKVSFICVNLDEFIFEGSLEVDFENGPRLVTKKHTYSLSSIRRVVYMTPQFVLGLEAHPEILSSNEKILLSRWKTLLNDLVDLMPEAEWLPGTPSSLSELSQQKLGDLWLARRMGLKIPETLVTADPAKAKRFVKKHGGRVVFRDYSIRRVHVNGELKTFKVDFVKTNSKAWSDIQTSPCVFQQYIDKLKEYRVIIAGRKTFVCQIHSQSGTRSKMDWRAYEFDKVVFESGDLPEKLLKSIALLARSRDLKFASIDLVEDKNGNIFFLEMNRPGAWLFVEALTGIPISRAVVAWLATGKM